MAKKSVDEFWKELNARPQIRTPAASGSAEGIKLPGLGLGAQAGVSSSSSGGITIPGLGTFTRTLPSNNTISKGSGAPGSNSTKGSLAGQGLEDVPINAAGAAAAGDPTVPLGSRGAWVAYDPTQAGVSQEEANAYLAGIQRLVNCLTDPDRGTRRQAVVTLQGRLVSGDTASGAPPPSAPMLQALMCGPLRGPLIGMLRDVQEKCRVVATELLLHGASIMPDVSPLMPPLMPAILQRMGHLPVQEPAEEIRLGLANLVSRLVSRAPARDLASFGADLCTFLCRCMEDGYPEIKKAGCATAATLASRAPAGSLAAHTERLAQGLVANLGHQHSRVRVSVLEALDALVAQGALPAGAVASIVAPGLRPLAHDRAPAVREALFKTLAGWMGYRQGSTTSQGTASSQGCTAVDGSSTSASGGVQGSLSDTPTANGNHPATAGSTATESGTADGATPFVLPSEAYAPDLLPILLVGVTDPQESLASLTLSLVEGCGEAWAATKQYQGTTPATGIAGPMEVDGTAGAVQGSSTTESDQKAQKDKADVDMGEGPSSTGEGGPTEASYAAQLGAPYTGRPSAGARRMACALLPQLLPPVVSDLTAWTVAQRAAAARSLHTLLVLSEGGVTSHLPSLLPALCSAIADEDAEVAGWVIKAVHVLGAHVAPSRWLPLMMDHLTQARLTHAQRASGLVVLAGLMYTAGRAHQPLSDQLLSALADCLVSAELRGCLEHGPARAQLLAVTTNLLRWAGPRCSQVMRPLYSVLLGLWGCESDPARRRSGPLPEAMAALAAASGAISGTGGAMEVTSFGQDAQPSTVSQPFVPQSQQQQQQGAGTTHGEGVPAGWAHVAAAHAGGLMEDLIRGAPGRWGGAEAPDWLTLRALLLTAPPATITALFPRAATAVLGPVAGDHEGDPALRLSVLALVDALLEDPVRGAGLGDPEVAKALLDKVLLPPLTWRAGKTAAAVRFSAVTALATLLRRKLAPPKLVLNLVEDGTLLPLIAQELDEDWYVDVRLAACYVAESLMRLVGHKLGHEPRRALYPELLKRLDDSNNGVRIAACNALVAFSDTMAKDYCETNAGYLAQGIVIHMDDSEPSVQEAAAAALEALAAKKPVAVRDELLKVRDRFRAKHYCDRVLAACAAAASSAERPNQQQAGAQPLSTADMELS